MSKGLIFDPSPEELEALQQAGMRVVYLEDSYDYELAEEISAWAQERCHDAEVIMEFRPAVTAVSLKAPNGKIVAYKGFRAPREMLS